jgi:hypothetical protein
MTIQFRVVVGKKDERIEGPDDAEIVITVPLEVAKADGFDPAVEYMRGRLKAAGHAGRLFDVLKSGEAAAGISRLASRP